MLAAISVLGVRDAVEAEIAAVIPWGSTFAVTAVCAALAVLASAAPVLRRSRA
ncbi:hypothetical protein [Actinoplanes sp. G11-F43]|uniref:hypothetical protein n=1 Tax=Actinoplanes sp. G11-F43 TaxID=3424130 RepID=UPI003D32C541